MSGREKLYGLMAVFDTPEALTRAADRVYAQGHRHLDAFTPFPVEGLAEKLGYRGTILPWIVLAGGILGALAAYGLQYYSVMIDYPVNVGGRPLHSWPAFLVPAFEGGILGAALVGFVSMLALNRLPQPYHPVFNAENYAHGRGESFCLLIARADPQFDRTKLRRTLKRLGAKAVEDVPW